MDTPQKQQNPAMPGKRICVSSINKRLHRKRKSFFEVGYEGRRRTRVEIRKRLETFNDFLLSIGLKLNSVEIKKREDTDAEPMCVEEDEEEEDKQAQNGFTLRINGKSLNSSRSEAELLQTARAVDSSNLSMRNYRALRNALDYAEIPSLYKVNSFKKRMNQFFELHKNEFGCYVNAKEKVEFVLGKVHEKLGGHVENDTFSVKFSGDGTNITKTSVQLLNFTFTVLNDSDKCKTSSGNYILGNKTSRNKTKQKNSS